MVFLFSQHLSTSELDTCFWESIKEIVCTSVSNGKLGQLFRNPLDIGLVICRHW